MTLVKHFNDDTFRLVLILVIVDNIHSTDTTAFHFF
jgi:hypothetical protein